MRADIGESRAHRGPGTAEPDEKPKTGSRAEREPRQRTAKGRISPLREQPRLVARRAELSELAVALDLIERSPSSVALTGEPGIGKTRLVCELVAGASERGYLTLEGRGDEFERLLPLGIFVDALDRELGALGPSDLSELAPADLESLAATFPSLAPLSRKTGSETHGVGGRIHSLRALIARLAAHRPLVLALDDLHWADEASIELASDLVRRPEERVLLVLAYRSARAPQRVTAALEDAVRRGHGQQIELRPLSEAEVHELAGEEVDGRMRADLYRQSGGNPFYLQELARARGGQAGVPRAITAAIERELCTLSEDVLLAARAAAVAGDPFEPDLVAAAAGRDEEHVLEALDELLALDLVRPASTARRFRFRHPIVARAVYESVPRGWRIAAHKRTARLLSARGALPNACARHVRHCAHAGDKQAIALLAAAGHECAGDNPERAAEWFDAALGLAPRGSERAKLLVSMSRALTAAGRLGEGHEAIDRAVELMPAEPTRVRVHAVAHRAFIDQLLADPAAARRSLAQELSGLGDGHPAEAAELRCGLALSSFLDGNFESTQEEAAAALAADLPGGALRAELTALLALADCGLGRLSDAASRIGEAEQLSDGLSTRELSEHPTVSLWLALAVLSTERFTAAEDRLEQAIAQSRRSGRLHLLAGLHSAHALALIWRGRVAEAACAAEQALECSRVSEEEVFSSLACSLCAWTATQAASTTDGVGVPAEAEALTAEATGPSGFAGLARSMLAEVQLECGRPGRCRDLLTGAEGEPDIPALPPFGLRSFEVLVRAELALGCPDEAGALAERARREAEGLGLEAGLALATRAQATVTLAGGECKAAAELALASAAAAEAAKAPLEAARSRLVAGRALLDAGRNDEAADVLEQAGAELAERGALRYRDQAAHELRRLGRRVSRTRTPRDPDVGLEVLTERQRQVAELAARGFKNREIAAELYLAEPTIEKHLMHVFDRLGVSSRVAVAAIVERARNRSAT